MPDFSEILREETVFHKISLIGRILVPQSLFPVFLIQFGFRGSAAFRIISDRFAIIVIIVMIMIIIFPSSSSQSPSPSLSLSPPLSSLLLCQDVVHPTW